MPWHLLAKVVCEQPASELDISWIQIKPAAIYVAKWPIPDAGLGLFAKSDIQSNELLLEYAGYPFNHDRAKELRQNWEDTHLKSPLWGGLPGWKSFKDLQH